MTGGGAASHASGVSPIRPGAGRRWERARSYPGPRTRRPFGGGKTRRGAALPPSSSERTPERPVDERVDRPRLAEPDLFLLRVDVHVAEGRGSEGEDPARVALLAQHLAGGQSRGVRGRGVPHRAPVHEEPLVRSRRTSSPAASSLLRGFIPAARTRPPGPAHRRAEQLLEAGRREEVAGRSTTSGRGSEGEVESARGAEGGERLRDPPSAPPPDSSGTSAAPGRCRTGPPRRRASPSGTAPPATELGRPGPRRPPSRGPTGRATSSATSRATDAIDGSASPRKPSVPIAARSSAVRIFDVACRSSASRASSASIPDPSSLTASRCDAAPLDLHDHLDAGRPGVERVLDQLLHDGRRPLDHLARGDLVDEGVGEDPQSAPRRGRVAGGGIR